MGLSRRIAGAGLLGAGVAAVAHVAPGLTWLPSVRSRLPLLDGQGSNGTVALTFDDGPDPESTPALLEVLDDLGVRATFFLLGEMVEKAPSLAAELADAGHEIALHGWHHRNSLRVSPWALRASLARALDVVHDATGVRPVLYRPPYGAVSAATLWYTRSLGLTTVLWGAWGADWAVTATPATVLRTLAPDLVGGATVLLHDSDGQSSPGSWRSTLGAVRPLVGGLRERGLAVGPLREHGLPLAA